MERVEQDAEWSLMCPSQCPGLSECWGKEFEELYTKYERVSALWCTGLSECWEKEFEELYTKIRKGECVTMVNLHTYHK